MELPKETIANLTTSRFRTGMAALVLILATTVLLGWQFEIEFLKRPLPGLVAMNPLTAIGFLLAGIALINLKNIRLLRVLSCLIIGLGLMKILAVTTGWYIPVDTTLFYEKLQIDLTQGVSNRMAPNTAIAFIFVGWVFFLRTWNRTPIWIIELITVLALLQGVLSMIGYGYNVPEFYGILSMFPMAVNTAIGFVILTFGMLVIQPMGPFLTTIMSKGSGGFMAKMLLPLAVFLPIAFGALQLYGEKQSFYSTEFGLMLIIVLVVMTSCIVIWRVATLINEKDRKQRLIESELEELNIHLEETVIKRTSEAIISRNEAQDTAKRLQESEKRFRALVENGGDAVVIVSAEGKPTFASGSTFGVLGYTAEEFLETDFSQIVHPEDLEGVQNSIMEAIDNPGTPVSGRASRVKHKDGSWRWLEATLTNLLNDPAVNGIVNNFRDVTDKRESEARLKESETHFRETLDNMLEGVQIIGFDWTYQYVNAAFTAHRGKTRKDLLGSTMMESYPGIENSKLFKVLKRCMSNRKSYNFENQFTYPDGEEAWFELSVQPVPEGVFILSIDITDRKKVEDELQELNTSLEETIEKRTSQLQESNKELEAFSYSVSHDLRAPLRAINGFSQMLDQQNSNQLDDNGKRLLSIISSNAITMGQLIDDLLTFSKTGRKELHQTEVNMHAMALEVLNEELHETPEKISCVNISSLPSVHCDPKLMKQVWVNLISNAIKYSSTVEEPKIRIWSDVEDGQTVFHVADNGVGFDMQYADKLFGVFQRLHSKKDFDGTGVGLALASRIITKHEGRIWADAELNKGATFHFALPSNKKREQESEVELNTE